MFDPEKFGEAMGAAIRDAVAPLQKRIGELESLIAALPVPKDGKDGDAGPAGADGANGKDGKDGQHGERGADGTNGIQGQKGADGLGLAGAMIDRDGALQIMLTNGEVKSLGVVVARDGINGINGRDGVDGIGLDSFDLEYLADTHEIAIKATAQGRVKELRYPAGGIRPAGYWRDGAKAVAGEAWVHDGSLWIAVKDTPSKPDTKGDWIIAARKGRDGERGQKGGDATPPTPIKLG